MTATTILVTGAAEAGKFPGYHVTRSLSELGLPGARSYTAGRAVG